MDLCTTGGGHGELPRNSAPPGDSGQRGPQARRTVKLVRNPLKVRSISQLEERLDAICGIVRLWTLACLSLVSGLAQAQTDIPGARDPDGIPRFPRSWVVFFEEDGSLAPREFIVSAVEKIRRELRIDENSASMPPRSA